MNKRYLRKQIKANKQLLNQIILSKKKITTIQLMIYE